MEIPSKTIVTTTKNGIPLPNPKKYKGRLNIFKVLRVLFMLRDGRSNSALNSKFLQVATWKKPSGSVRPLHLENGSTSPALKPKPTVDDVHAEAKQEEIDVLSPPMSPFNSSYSNSRNNSVVNLSYLDLEGDDSSGDEEEEYEPYDIHGGDELVDAKAEEFIAQFYAEIRMQNQTYVKSGHY